MASQAGMYGLWNFGTPPNSGASRSDFLNKIGVVIVVSIYYNCGINLP